MKNRILILISIILNALVLVSVFLGLGDFIYQQLWIPLVIIVTLCAQLWCLFKNKRNTAVRVGNYALWVALLAQLICVGLALFEPETDSLLWSLGMFIWFSSVLILGISILYYWIGVFIPEKSTTVSPTL